jgi:bifunctional non-homologous end joining protein LigD
LGCLARVSPLASPRQQALAKLKSACARSSGFIEPCLPSLADRPPSGRDWIHEIKHDGFRLLACRDPAGIGLLTRNGNDFTARYPLIVEALAAPPVRSCVIDGEAVACDGAGLSIFEKLRWRHHDGHVFMWAFDQLELDGQDLRRETLEARKGALARLLKKAKVGLQFNKHITVSEDIVLRHACKLGLEGIVSKRLGSRYISGRSRDWLKFKNPDAPAVKREFEGDWGKTGGGCERGARTVPNVKLLLASAKYLLAQAHRPKDGCA